MKWSLSGSLLYIILVAWTHCFVYISNDVATRGYIHSVFIIFVIPLRRPPPAGTLEHSTIKSHPNYNR